MTAQPLAPDDLLAAADRLIEIPSRDTTGLWPRTSAFLIRAALEEALTELWQRLGLRMAECSMHAQLVSLPVYVDPPLAQAIRAAWGELSDACHHHPYELAPTAWQLRGWLAVVRRAREVVAGHSTSALP